MSVNIARLRFSGAIGLVALVSVSLKFALLRADVGIDPVAVANDLGAIEAKRGMATKVSPLFGSALMTASLGQCRLSASTLPPSGELDRSITSALQDYPRLRYAWRQSISADRPRLGPLATFQWARALNRLGIAQRWQPLLLVGDNGRCDSRLLDFGPVAARFRQEVPSRR